jgi:hypothetical protein
VRTPTGRRIRRYGSALRPRCLRHLRNLNADSYAANVKSATCFTSLYKRLRIYYQLYKRLIVYVTERISTECIALHASTTQNLRTTAQKYDTDSHILIIDNGCSASITNDLTDFIFPPFKVKASIQGYSGSTNATHIGTVC